MSLSLRRTSFRDIRFDTGEVTSPYALRRDELASALEPLRGATARRLGVRLAGSGSRPVSTSRGGFRASASGDEVGVPLVDISRGNRPPRGSGPSVRWDF